MTIRAPSITTDSVATRVISSEQLTEVLEAHARWLKSGSGEGKRCDLRNTNLRCYDLSNAILTEAILTGADLTGAKLVLAQLQSAHLGEAILRDSIFHSADLSKAILSSTDSQGSIFVEANLEEADLRSANFQRANFHKSRLGAAKLDQANLAEAILREANLTKSSLWKTNLRETDLSDANLEGTTGLLTKQMGGANVSRAILPDVILRFEGLDQAREICDKAGKVFITMLLGCIYVWLTIATTRDARLLTNSATSPLPVIQTEIPIVGFYWAAPLVLVGLYLYFHLYMQHLWKGLGGLPAVFPDGIELDEKAHPWLLTSILRTHVAKLRENWTLEARLECAVSIMLGWWLVPITLIGLWARCIPRHDWFLTSFHIFLLVFSIICGTWFQHLVKVTLRDERQRPIQLKANISHLQPYREVLRRGWRYAVIGLGALLLLVVVSDGAINGEVISSRYHTLPYPTVTLVTAVTVVTLKDISFSSMTDLSRRVIPLIFPISTFANLDEQDVSTKPTNWFLRDENELTRIVHGARLRDMDLRNASAFKAFLVNADLAWADLTKADLLGANLAEANLHDANLTKAILSRANLTKAILDSANLSEADLGGANLTKARLLEANLTKARLPDANLTEANLSRANLTKTYLPSADLTEANLSGADLTEANLSRANLTKTDLFGADLTEAHLDQANLTKADLRESNLTRTIGLLQWQIDQACVNQNTDLPHGLTRPKPCS